MTYKTDITIRAAVEAAGGREAVRTACGLGSRQAVMKWENNNSLPRTEFTGETDYAETIGALCRRNGKRQFTKNALLTVSRESRKVS